jgi:hypothetical protein
MGSAQAPAEASIAWLFSAATPSAVIKARKGPLSVRSRCVRRWQRRTSLLTWRSSLVRSLRTSRASSRTGFPREKATIRPSTDSTYAAPVAASCAADCEMPAPPANTKVHTTIAAITVPAATDCFSCGRCVREDFCRMLVSSNSVNRVCGLQPQAEGSCQRPARCMAGGYLSLVLTTCTRRFSPAKGLSRFFRCVAPYPTVTRRFVSIPYFSDRKRFTASARRSDSP